MKAAKQNAAARARMPPGGAQLQTGPVRPTPISRTVPISAQVSDRHWWASAAREVAPSRRCKPGPARCRSSPRWRWPHPPARWPQSSRLVTSPARRRPAASRKSARAIRKLRSRSQAESRQQQRRAQRQPKCRDRDGADVDKRIDGFGRHARCAPQTAASTTRMSPRRAVARPTVSVVMVFDPSPRQGAPPMVQTVYGSKGEGRIGMSKARAPLAGSSEGSSRLPGLCAGGWWGQKADICGQWHG